MNRLSLLRARLKNYPGRDVIHDGLKRARRAAFNLLPSIEPSSVGDVVYQEPDYSRWDALPTAQIALVADRVRGDRATRMKRVTLYRGQLSLDPNGRQIFDDRRVIWGSYDLVGREREPSLASFLRGPTSRQRELANLIGAYDNNYFHFLYDTMSKVALIELYAPAGVPFVVSETLMRQPYFQDALRMGVLDGHELIVQAAHDRIGGDVIWAPSPGEPRREDLLSLARRFGADRLPSAPGLRLYVARGPKALNARRLRNEAQLYRALAERGFIFFDAQEHDLATQIATFARAEIVVAPHGAGLTNVIWRQGRPLTVVEMVNPTLHTFDMAYLSCVLGYRHHIVDNRGDIGQPLKASSDADVPSVLRIVDEAVAQASK